MFFVVYLSGIFLPTHNLPLEFSLACREISLWLTSSYPVFDSLTIKEKIVEKRSPSMMKFV